MAKTLVDQEFVCSDPATISNVQGSFAAQSFDSTHIANTTLQTHLRAPFALSGLLS